MSVHVIVITIAGEREKFVRNEDLFVGDKDELNKLCRQFVST